MTMAQQFTRARENALRTAGIHAEQTGEFGPAAREPAGLPITVLTTDAELSDALGKAMLGEHEIVTAADAEQAVELAAAGKCAILVTDQALTQAEIARITSQLRPHDPAMVTIAVGNRGQDSVLLRLMSCAAVDRFMLKPLTPALARIVIESAEREHRSRKPQQNARPAAAEAQRRATPQRKEHGARDGSNVTQPVKVGPRRPEPVPVQPEVEAASASFAPPAIQSDIRAQAVPSSLEDADIQPISQARVASLSSEPASVQLVSRAAPEPHPSEPADAQPRSSDSADVQPSVPVELESAASVQPTIPATAAPARPLANIPRPSWIALLAAVAAVGGLVWWVMSQRLPDIDPRQVIASNLSAAQAAFDDGRYVEPAEHSALHHFSTVLALDPGNAAARAGIDRIADNFAAGAATLIDTARFAEAVSALQSLRRLHPNDSRIASLEIRLRSKLEQEFPQIRPAVVLEEPQPEHVEVAKAAAPSKGTEKAGNERVVRSAPRNVPAPQDPRTLQTRMLADAAQAIERNQLETAVRLLTAAREMGAASDDLATLNLKLETAEQNERDIRLAAVAQAASEQPERTMPEPVPTPAQSAAVVPPPVAVVPEPVLARMVQPEYPSEARLRGVEGWVDLSFVVSAAGDVTEPRIEASSKRHLFGRPALNAVRQWKYQPRPLEGSPPPRTQVRVQFKLQD